MAMRRLLGLGALAGLLAASALLAVAAAARRRVWYVPASEGNGWPDWLAGPFRHLDLVLPPSRGALLLVVMLACYLVALACARGGIPVRAGVGAVIAAHVLFVLAPPLFSADVFGYVDYARLAVVHGLNPYVHGAADALHDPAVPWVRWHDIPTPYGPLFTLLSMPLAWLSVPAALWACKIAAGLLSLGCCALVWRIAARRGLAPLPALLFVGLNPLLLAYAVGGAHNDFLLLALLLAAVLLALEERPAGAGAFGVLAVGVKAPAGLVLPFLLAARPSAPRAPQWARRVVVGAAAAAVVLLAVGFVAFGRETFAFVSQIHEQQRFVASDSVPGRVSAALGFARLPEGLRLLFALSFAGALAWLLWRTWRGRIDWLDAAGWATLALLLSTAWLVPWYVVWLLPLAAVARDPRLRGATLLFCVFVVATRVTYQLV
ncbi:MAG: polyprenol phosphomannose-dependent alpha 1,6 mannosyltransferase MptB [Actinobacteria bacterium]|nr:polyprenol phosphomannose-dependent alpha 1,6 mannosyltransferase MptB [Actinomycetota bacterium]